ncbi:elongation factor G [Striga asiatica]|uniref:Elongation factor G n=1 Tax=Striga asiatica TaxID=4170 RepID=A0A5A7RF97_STRAF|nr:elongation factor G [Striga asiatica]
MSQPNINRTAPASHADQVTCVRRWDPPPPPFEKSATVLNLSPAVRASTCRRRACASPLLGFFRAQHKTAKNPLLLIMAQELEDGEFWLPSDFLTDDDDELLLDFKPDRLKTKAGGEFSRGYASSFGFNSDLSSPVDSVTGSTETESDEDDSVSVAGLTRKMAHSTFLDFDMFSEFNRKNFKLSSSPQSTLCACRMEPDPNRVSRVPSSAAAAAGDITEEQMIQETTPFQSTSLFAPPPGPAHVFAQVQKLNTAIFNSSSAQTETQAQLAYLQLQALQIEQMKQLQMMEQRFCGEAGRPRGLSTAAWPSLQHHPQPLRQPPPRTAPGSRVRPAFLGETCMNKGRSGTGVFLPRPYIPNPSETRIKQGGGSVLWPELVVAATNAHRQSVKR